MVTRSCRPEKISDVAGGGRRGGGGTRWRRRHEREEEENVACGGCGSGSSLQKVDAFEACLHMSEQQLQCVCCLNSGGFSPLCGNANANATAAANATTVDGTLLTFPRSPGRGLTCTRITQPPKPYRVLPCRLRAYTTSMAVTVFLFACSVYVTASRITFSRNTLRTPRVSS